MLSSPNSQIWCRLNPVTQVIHDETSDFNYLSQFLVILSSVYNISNNVICLNYVLLGTPLDESFMPLYLELDATQREEWTIAQLSAEVIREERLMPTRLGMYKARELNCYHIFYLPTIFLLRQ